MIWQENLKICSLDPFLWPPCLAFYISGHRTPCCCPQITMLCSGCSLLLDTFPLTSFPPQCDNPCPPFMTFLKYLVIQKPSLSLVTSGLGTHFMPWNSPCIALLSYLLGHVNSKCVDSEPRGQAGWWCHCQKPLFSVVPLLPAGRAWWLSY